MAGRAVSPGRRNNKWSLRGGNVCLRDVITSAPEAFKNKSKSNSKPVNTPLTNCPDLGQLVNAEIE